MDPPWSLTVSPGVRLRVRSNKVPTVCSMDHSGHHGDKGISKRGWGRVRKDPVRQCYIIISTRRHHNRHRVLQAEDRAVSQKAELLGLAASWVEEGRG